MNKENISNVSRSKSQQTFLILSSCLINFFKLFLTNNKCFKFKARNMTRFVAQFAYFFVQLHGFHCTMINKNLAATLNLSWNCWVNFFFVVAWIWIFRDLIEGWKFNFSNTTCILLKKKRFNFLDFVFLQSIYFSIFGWPEKDLNNELCVITGGGGGLGRLLAMRLVRLGVKVILWDINQDGKILFFCFIERHHVESS